MGMAGLLAEAELLWQRDGICWEGGRARAAFRGCGDKAASGDEG